MANKVDHRSSGQTDVASYMPNGTATSTNPPYNEKDVFRRKAGATIAPNM